MSTVNSKLPPPMRVKLLNGDMVGHIGDIEAAYIACKVADEAVNIIFVFVYSSINLGGMRKLECST